MQFLNPHSFLFSFFTKVSKNLNSLYAYPWTENKLSSEINEDIKAEPKVHDCTDEVTKKIRSSKNIENKSLTEMKESMPTQDINKSLDERSDNIANITNKETGGNGQSNQKVVKKKVYTIGYNIVKHIKRWIY